MSEITHLKGFIRDVRYQTHLNASLAAYSFEDFDINHSKGFGMVHFPNGPIGYSKWISPKRTRSYPFERLYNTYSAPMRLTIIPVLKDEGQDGDLDRIQYSTISWMNLLNVYVVLGFYADARKNTSALQIHRSKLTGQKLDVASIRAQMLEISQYKQSALHWNRSLIENQFVKTYQKALDAYEEIGKRTGVTVHDRAVQELYLRQLMQDFARFKDISLRGSRGAALRETNTVHGLEYLTDGSKATFEIENYLGGVYYLTADEIVRDADKYVIQESKNATHSFLPSTADIKDGLFKLILFSNLDSLMLNDRPITFVTRLKLTGASVRSSLRLPCTQEQLESFHRVNQNRMTTGNLASIKKLNLEARHNQKLEIEIRGNR